MKAGSAPTTPLAFLATLCIALSGCGGSSEPGPGEVSHGYWSAVRAGDPDACGFLTQERQRAEVRDTQGVLPGVRSCSDIISRTGPATVLSEDSVTVESEKITGDSATVKLKSNQVDYLVRRDGRWLLTINPADRDAGVTSEQASSANEEADEISAPSEDEGLNGPAPRSMERNPSASAARACATGFNSDRESVAQLAETIAAFPGEGFGWIEYLDEQAERCRVVIAIDGTSVYFNETAVGFKRGREGPTEDLYADRPALAFSPDLKVETDGTIGFD